jgi:hypothetical protein
MLGRCANVRTSLGSVVLVTSQVRLSSLLTYLKEPEKGSLPLQPAV